MRIKIVLYFVYFSLKNFSNPWYFFQIHSKYFNKKKWIFSKYEIESCIPKNRKLTSYRINSSVNSTQLLEKLNFPLFGKPEWWQNAHGIKFIETNKTELFPKTLSLSEDQILKLSSKYDKTILDSQKLLQIQLNQDYA